MKNKGFTLIEMMLTIAIILVLLAIGVPLYFVMKGNNGVNVAEKIVLADIKRARSTAASQGSATVNLTLAVSGGTSVKITDGGGNLVWQETLPYRATVATDWGNGLVTFQQNGVANIGGPANGIVTVSQQNATITRQIKIVTFTGGILEQ